MVARSLFYALLVWATYSSSRGDERNLSPVFTHDMNNLALSESTPVGHYVYTLQGEDPEGAPIRYGIAGTDKFQVDPDTGDVTLVKSLDREINDTLKFLVWIEEQPSAGVGNTNRVRLPVSVIVLDENDNAPLFRDSPYEVTVPEDETIGKTILQSIRVEDLDTVGDNLEVTCVPSNQWPEACDVFEVVSLEASQSEFRGALVLRQALDYNKRQFYQLDLLATDGALNSSTSVEVHVQDVQNLPPVFSSSLSGTVQEDAPIGTLVLTLRARDGDRRDPRPISYDLLTDPHDFFIVDSVTGEVKTAKPLDREALDEPSSPLNLTVRAREIINNQPVTSPLTSTTAQMFITIRDVNDEPPRFSRPEYSVQIPENFPIGSALPNLDIVVTDTDLGKNSGFSLRLSDVSGAFTVEPGAANGTAHVNIRLNKSLDYEQADMSKFIIVVIAEELYTNPRLSSKATVLVSVTDVNDNPPQFPDDAYWTRLSETAAPGSHVITITATDRDTGRFGTDGLVYELLGVGAELFSVDNRSGAVSVAACGSPGRAPCLDYEARKEYYLSFKATDEDGAGMNAIVPLKISLDDADDNSPVFTTDLYKVVVDEDAVKLDPEVQVQARDADETSELRYSIPDDDSPFWVDPVTGKLGVHGHVGPAGDQPVYITLVATDGLHNATSRVEVRIRDVNNHAPVFQPDRYNASITEDSPLGTEVVTVSATDMDTGTNAAIQYSIRVGSHDAFAVDNATGVVTVASKLDYDKRNTYRITVIAQDKGVPSLTGSAELTVTIVNVNDKKPYFTPESQHAEVSEDAEVGTLVHTLVAMDPDILNIEDLKYELSVEPPMVIDAMGFQVNDTSDFASWFAVSPAGAVLVAAPLQRPRASVVTLSVVVIDPTARELQRGFGSLMIVIVEVNRYPPVFPQSHYSLRLPEEQPLETVLDTFRATDKDSAISHYEIVPPSPYFTIDNATGTVRSAQRIDYEQVKHIDLTVVAYDTGAPQLSSNATVSVDVVNLNDEAPRFDVGAYEASVVENAKEGAALLTVHAVDDDEGQFGEVRYSLSGENAAKFTIDPLSGQVSVARAAAIDHENTTELWLHVTATDVAPPGQSRSATVPIHITVTDENDNSPEFSQQAYRETISENITLDPPATILMVSAEDRDAGLNAEVAYSITEQSEPGAFRIDPVTGIIYPSAAPEGNRTYELTVAATDQNGAGPHSATARVQIHVLTVNKHAPVFVTPAEQDETVEIAENGEADQLVMRVLAEDRDAGELGHVTYYLREGDLDSAESEHFRIDRDTGDVTTRVSFDREQADTYTLVLVARDGGSPPFTSLRLLTVRVLDLDDNAPQFQHALYHLQLPENQPPGVAIGTITATDKDIGENGRVYYHILEGNQDGAFTLDRTQGVLRANVSFDREKQAEYTLTVHASNNPLLERVDALNSIDGVETNNASDRDTSVATVKITVLDENDNEPVFEKKIYYAGVKRAALAGDVVATVAASDADNGSLAYVIAASHLYRAGENTSSGSIVPSPFNISNDGVLRAATAMAEYNQARFVLDVLAREADAPFRGVSAQVYVWVVSEEQTVLMVVSRECAAARSGLETLRSELTARAGRLVIVGGTRRYTHEGRLADDWCEVRLHGVEQSSSEAMPAAQVLARLDAQYDSLRPLYTAGGVETLAPALTTRAEAAFDPALAALVALLIVLFTGLVTFLVVCACLRHWSLPPPRSLDSSKGDSLARRRILDELSTTENPLWLETKLRPYEEQELTMNVFGEPERQAPPDNTYATIPGGAERDYATLAPLEARLGFQGSTFQPPSPPDTPEPPPRPAPLPAL